MKGHEKVVEVLNFLLADELTAISQYMVHSEMAAAWGYEKLHEAFEKRAMDEMEHAEKIIGRILFMESVPVVSKLNQMKIGHDVPKQLEYDQSAELGAIKAYNDAIRLVTELNDHATARFLGDILHDEEEHIDNIEEMQEQISHMGIQIFLSTQIKK